MNAVRMSLLKDAVSPVSGLEGQNLHLYLFNCQTSETWHKSMNNQFVNSIEQQEVLALCEIISLWKYRVQ